MAELLKMHINIHIEKIPLFPKLKTHDIIL